MGGGVGGGCGVCVCACYKKDGGGGVTLVVQFKVNYIRMEIQLVE